jgi:tRNA threonylcarbamoyladenosine biosynthesis protein TsaB
MVLLALDTSAAAGSAAIVRDGVLAIERNGDGSRPHGERLPRELMAILRDTQLTLADVDGFAVVTGPGSFTGLRVGIASIQGLALARQKLVAPVTSFEALAAVARPSSDLGRPTSVIATWIDAHRGEVFASLYAADGRTVLEPPTSLTPEATLDEWSRTRLDPAVRIYFAGSGAIRYADLVRTRFGERAVLPAHEPTLAGSAGLIAAADWSRALTPHALVPLYVRRPYVEVARDARPVAKP